MALPLPRSSARAAPGRRRASASAPKPQAAGLAPAQTLELIANLAHAVVVQAEFLRRDAAEHRAPGHILDSIDALVAHAHDTRLQSEHIAETLRGERPAPAAAPPSQPAPDSAPRPPGANETREAALTFAIEMMLGGASKPEIERRLAREFGRHDARELAAEAHAHRQG